MSTENQEPGSFMRSLLRSSDAIEALAKSTGAEDEIKDFLAKATALEILRQMDAVDGWHTDADEKIICENLEQQSVTKLLDIMIWNRIYDICDDPTEPESGGSIWGGPGAMPHIAASDAEDGSKRLQLITTQSGAPPTKSGHGAIDDSQLSAGEQLSGSDLISRLDQHRDESRLPARLGFLYQKGRGWYDPANMRQSWMSSTI